MKKLHKLLSIFTIGLLVISCGNDEFSNDPIDQQKSEKSEILEFKYNGITYSSEYTLLSDSIFDIKDEKVAEVYQKIMTNPNLATFVGQDNSISYYDSYSDLKNESQENPSTKASAYRPDQALTSVKITFAIWDDINQKGRTKTFTPNPLGYIAIETLDEPAPVLFNFNDQTTSFRANSNWKPIAGVPAPKTPPYLLVTLFEHHYYGGRSITFQGTSIECAIDDLGQKKFNPFKATGRSNVWNKRTSSIEVWCHKGKP